MLSETFKGILPFLATLAAAFALQSHFQQVSFPLLCASLFCVEALAYSMYWMVIYPFCISPLRGLPQARVTYANRNDVQKALLTAQNQGGKFLLGHGLAAYEQPAGHTFRRWMKHIPNDGLIFYRGLLYQDRLLVTNPQTLSEILVTRADDFQKPRIVRAFLRTIIGDGLLVTEEGLHQFQRKIIAPAFTFRAVKDMYPVFWRKAKQFTKVVGDQVARGLSDGPDGRQVETASVLEIGRWASRLSLDVIGIVLGRDFQTLANSHDPLIESYKELTAPTVENQLYFLCSMILSTDFVSMLPWRMNERNKRLLGNITSTCLDMIESKKEELRSTIKAPSHRDLLSTMIESRSFSDCQLVDHILTFLAAGHETTQSSFTWVAYLLAKHPEVQQRLRAEVVENLPSPRLADTSEADLSLDVVDKLPVLNAVCNETLRLYPVVPLTVRNAIRPTQLAGQQISAGTQVMISPWAINHDETLWGSDAGDFKPERWIDTDETGKQRANNTGGASSNYAFLTFLHGPRSCIGQGFAKAELRFAVAAFVAHFDIQMADNSEVVIPYGVAAVKPKNGMHLRLKPLLV